MALLRPRFIACLALAWLALTVSTVEFSAPPDRLASVDRTGLGAVR